MAASHACRSYHLLDASNIKDVYQLTDEEVKELQTYVIDKSYSHDDFMAMRKKEPINEKKPKREYIGGFSITIEPEISSVSSLQF